MQKKYSDIIYQNYPELLDIADETEQCIKSLLEKFNDRELKLFDLPPHQRIFLFITTRSVKTFFSIMELCKKGFGQDVATLLRSLLENLVTVKYILHDKNNADDKAARFVAYKWVIFKRQLLEQERKVRRGSDEQKEEFLLKKKRVLKGVDDFKEKFNVSSDRALVTWSGKTIRDMAKEVGRELLHEYETTFRLCSRFSHPSILGDNEYIVQNDKSLVFSALPSDIGVVANLKSAIKYILDFQFLINNLFNFENEGHLRKLQNKLLEALSLEKYQDRPLSGDSKNKKQTSSIKESRIVFKTQM